MLSPKDIATIKAKIEALEHSRERCTDSRLLHVIDAWIKELKEKLESDS